MTAYGNFDPKGSIPVMLKNYVAKQKIQVPAKI
jgi:hypothetical protein